MVKAMNVRRAALLALGAAAAVWVGPSSAQGQVLVTEVIADPTGTDAQREWIEIYNAGPRAVDLSNWKVGDEESEPTSGPGGEGMFKFPNGTSIAPRQVFVIANTSSGFQSLYGFKPNFEVDPNTALGDDPAVPNMTPYTTWATATALALANGGDHALLVNDLDAIVDGTNWGNVTKFFKNGPTLGSNQSMERVPADVDTDSASDWIVRASGQATPGQVTLSVVPEPGALSVLALAAAVGAASRRRRAW